MSEVARLLVVGLVGAVGFSTGAGNCLSAGSFTHGKSAAHADGALRLTTTHQGELMGGVVSSLVNLEADRPFKGFLIYTDKGRWSSDLPADAQFKETCDSDRGPQRSVTHRNSYPKAGLTLILEHEKHPPDLPSSPSSSSSSSSHTTHISAIIMEDIRRWYWLNATLPPNHERSTEHYL